MFLLSTPLRNFFAPHMREIILGLPSVPWEEQTGIVLRIKEVWGFKYRGGPQNERRAPGCMFHAPKRPCSYGGIIYSFFRICQHIFLNLFLITDSVPIIKHFSVSDGLTVVLSFQGVKTVLNNSMSGHKNRLFRLRIPYGRNWMKKL